MLNTLAPIFIPIIIGTILVHVKYIGKDLNKDIKLFVLRVAVPCKIFTSIRSLDLDTAQQFFPVAGSFVLLSVLSIVLLYFLLPVKDNRIKAAFILTASFGNYGYIGWAVLESAFGAEGLTRAIFFNTLWWPILIFCTVLVTKLMKIESKVNVKSYIINIAIPTTALLVGLLFSFVEIPIYTPLLDTITTFGDMTSTLILFSVGLSISIGESLKNLRLAIIPAILRPVFGFFVAFLIVTVLGVSDPISRDVILIDSTMPVGVMVIVMADMIGLDENLTSSILIISTLLSLITIPLVFFILGV